MSESINYGVVGLGRAGWDIHIRELRARPDAKVVAVVDTVAERREQARMELGSTPYESLKDLLADPAVEVVVVATPSVMHAPDAIAALDAGKHVVVEKPMCMNIAEADDMIRAAHRNGKKLLIHHNMRFGRIYTYLRQLIDSGMIGRVFHIRHHNAGFNRRNDWQTLARNGGGVLNNTVSHSLDVILSILDAKVTGVLGDLQQIASAGDVEDHVKILMRAENGRTADIEVSLAENIAAAVPAWVVCGACGTMTSDGKTATIKYFDPAQAAKLEAIDGPAKDRKYGSGDILPWQERVEPFEGPSMGTFYDNVYGVLRQDKPMHITPESVREVIRVIGEIRKGTPFPGR